MSSLKRLETTLYTVYRLCAKKSMLLFSQIMVYNARLEALFLAKKAEFRLAGKSVHERIAFHGTSAENARGIAEQVSAFFLPSIQSFSWRGNQFTSFFLPRNQSFFHRTLAENASGIVEQVSTFFLPRMQSLSWWGNQFTSFFSPRNRRFFHGTLAENARGIDEQVSAFFLPRKRNFQRHISRKCAQHC
jgi:hypothetical protein